jgi:hypothetical protein
MLGVCGLATLRLPLNLSLEGSSAGDPPPLKDAA